MDSAACNVSGIKGRLRSKSLPAYMVAASGEESWISYGEEEADFALPENAMDPEYKTFLNSLTVHGKSYLLKTWMGNPQRRIRLKYEEECNEEGTGYSAAVDSRTRSGSNEIADAEKCFESTKRLEPDRTANKNRVLEKKRETIDENKQGFVDNVRICGGSIVLVRDNKEIVMHEEEGEEEQEERVKAKQEILDEHEDSLRKSTALSMPSLTQDSSISVIAAYQSYLETIRKMAPTYFRNKLIEAISSPFNQSEYENLIVQARMRNPQVKLKHLRSDSIPYKTNIPGSSYFDYFPDLAKAVEQADCYKGLALMRGFFFWLKTVQALICGLNWVRAH
ncbi:uncharacterized protein LOC110100810 [Dendrobium catenatum]|uniref:Uncharacterized protein n=1 Tax=Dendrobium catenatum TaxID=906689 RepID=A0A2I0WM31_9ASPA|nr:uncharacterized protein LOC110100810 [Dendrobium catenatum]PKU76719.1 hypothetical protein MA16_Dca001325 [Dendrobium catenatum]